MKPIEPETNLESFAAHAAAAPDRVAVADGDRVTTYGRLFSGVVQVRDLLREAGVGRGDIVAVAGPRGADLAAAIYGIWLAGAAYVAIDPDQPEQRLDEVLQDAGAQVVLASGRAIPRRDDLTVIALPAVDEAPHTEPFAVKGDPDSCAFLIYTSGSTGRPKASRLPHRGLANVVQHFTSEMDLTGADAIIWMATISFDMSDMQLHLSLGAGCTVVVAPDETLIDGAVMRRYIERHNVTLLLATPTTWRMVFDQVGDVLRDRRVLFGGEPSTLALVRRLAATGARLYHLYGPSETSIICTSYRVTEPVQRLTVGGAIQNTIIWAADPDGEELPTGERGELYIAGVGVALGYHNRPELTASQFGEHPEHGLFYRSGDLGRIDADGTIEILGRADRQIKLRGVRIELGDIETALQSHPAVRAAAVVVVGDRGTDAALVACIETSDGSISQEELWEHARARLPRAMVPQEFWVTDELPLNANRKVDYPALILGAELRRAEAGVSAAPPEFDVSTSDELVAELIGMWRNLLDRNDVGPETNFFVHGGHSLLGMVLLRRVEQATGAALRLTDLFKHPTPVRLGERIRASVLAAA